MRLQARMRVIWAVVLALGLTLLSVASATAGDKHNAPTTLTCNGTLITFFGNPHSNVNSAVPIAGGGSFKFTEIHFFVHGTTQEIFSFTTNYPRRPTITCTGTVSEEGELFDVLAKGVLRPGR